MIRSARHRVRAEQSFMGTKTLGSMTSRTGTMTGTNFQFRQSASAPIKLPKLKPRPTAQKEPIYPAVTRSQREHMAMLRKAKTPPPPESESEEGEEGEGGEKKKKKKRKRPKPLNHPEWKGGSALSLNSDGSIKIFPLPKLPPKPKKAPMKIPRAVFNIPVPTISEQKKMFKRFDPNGNGMLSLAEIDKGIKDVLPDKDNKPAVIRAYKAADDDGQGYVTMKGGEFELFLRFLTYYNNLYTDFMSIDKGGDGRVERAEFCANAKLFGIKDPDKAFDQMDDNGGGIVLFDEFCDWMVKYNPGRGDGDDSGLPTEANSPTGNDRATAILKGPKAIMNITVPPKKEAMEIFTRMDPNKNGMLSLAELDKGVIEIWPEFNNKPAIMRAYKAADASGEGFVTRKEFEFFLRYLAYYNNLWADFDEIDTSDDRRIERHEFMANAGKFGVNDPDTAFDEMDANGGGFILFEEFCEWMARNNPGWGDKDDTNDEPPETPAMAAAPAPEADDDGEKPAENGEDEEGDDGDKKNEEDDANDDAEKDETPAEEEKEEDPPPEEDTPPADEEEAPPPEDPEPEAEEDDKKEDEAEKEEEKKEDEPEKDEKDGDGGEKDEDAPDWI